MDNSENLQVKINDFNDRLDAKQAEAFQLINKLVSGELTEAEFKESNKLITESLRELKKERAELIKKQEEETSKRG